MLGSSTSARTLPTEHVLVVPADRVDEAVSATSLAELRKIWDTVPGGGGGGFSFGFSAATAAAGSTKKAKAAKKKAAAAPASRIERMSAARDARSTDKVVVECFAQGSKIRARVVSDGFDPTKNCQFPKAIRAVGKRFTVDTVVDAGSFYRVRGNIEECA